MMSPLPGQSILLKNRTEAKGMLKDVTYCEGAYDCMENADAAVILTEWDQFRALDISRIKTLLSEPVLIDLRNIYPLHEVEELDYHSIGRPQ